MDTFSAKCAIIYQEKEYLFGVRISELPVGIGGIAEAMFGICVTFTKAKI